MLKVTLFWQSNESFCVRDGSTIISIIFALFFEKVQQYSRNVCMTTGFKNWLQISPFDKIKTLK